MDPLDVNFIPPPAYSEEEFDQKTSRATELSLELAKWERPKIEIDEEGFPRYDPAMFEEPPRAQKGKDQPTTTTFRSSSISKRPLPLPNPKSATSSTDAGPSTLRQTQPLHISKKSISKAEEAAIIPASYSRTKYTPEDIPPYAVQNLHVTTPSSQSDQSIEDTPEDNPPYTAMDPHLSTASIPGQSIEDTSEDNPPYTAIDPHSTASIPGQSSENTSEDNPPYTAMDLRGSTSSIPNESIEDTLEDNPPYEPNYPAEPPYDEQPQSENWDGRIPRQEVISEPGGSLDRPQSPEFELPEHLGQGREILTPNSATAANQMFNRQSQYTAASNPPFHRGPQLSNPDTATQLQSRYSIALNPPVHRGPQQHFSLPPAPRTLPRIHPSDRPRSQSTIPTSPSALSQPAAAPRVVFNHNVAYGKNAMGGQVTQFRPKAQTPQTPFQARYDPTTFYNAAVSSHLSTPMTVPDQSPHLSYPVQRPQVWPNQTPANSAVNQPRQWGWHPPGRPSNAYHSVTDTSYGGGGTDVSRYSHYPVTNNGYFSQ